MSRAFNRIMISSVVFLLASPLAMKLGSADDYMPEKFESEQFVEYERQLNAMLKTRHDEEKKFVNKIVGKVRLGKIPSRLVSTTYSWVRNKRPDTNYPFVYFERVIRIQAKAIGLEDEIPPFDYSIYGSAGQRSIGQNGSAGQKTDTRKNSFFRAGNRR